MAFTRICPPAAGKRRAYCVYRIVWRCGFLKVSATADKSEQESPLGEARSAKSVFVSEDPEGAKK